MIRLLFIIACFAFVGCTPTPSEVPAPPTETVAEPLVPAVSTCLDMHLGTFEFSSNRGSRFTRGDTFQTQYHAEGTVSHFQLDWENDCKYIITLRETDEETYAVYLDRPLAVEITKVSHDTMWFTGVMDSGVSFRDTLLRVGD
jgi:hypothetical protein